MSIEVAAVAAKEVGEVALKEVAIEGAKEAAEATAEEVAAEFGVVEEVEGLDLEALRQAAGEGAETAETEPIQDSNGEVRHMVRPEEAAHYEELGLDSQNVAGRECLVRSDVDWDAVDGYGRTNLERAEQGYAPLDPDGKSYELHHVQQENDGMLAELRQQEHRGKGIDGILHDKTGPSEVDHDAFEADRKAHWKARASDIREAQA